MNKQKLKERERKMRNNKGITLIALIITIIVLLILAVVAINSVKETGIINYAQNAVDEYSAGQTKENEAIAGYMEYLDKYDPSKKKDNTLVAMYKAGTLKQGDYVSYSPDGVSSYELASSLTGMDDSQTIARENLAWRVLGYDETKNQILLISSEPTLDGMQIDGETGVANYKDILNNTCNTLYSNSTIKATAKSIDKAEAKKYLGVLEEEEAEGKFSSGAEYLEELGAVRTEILMGPNTEIYTSEEFDFETGNLPFAYLVAEEAMLEWNSSASYPDIMKSAIWIGIYFLVEDNTQNLRYLRPVVALDESTTIEDVRILNEEEIPEWKWYDKYGKYEGS